jgi:hypothetical protein
MEAMMRRLLFSFLAAAAISGCSATAASTGLPAGRLPVEVESVEMLQLESYPVQLMLHVTGWLPNPCSDPAWVVTDPGPVVLKVELVAVPQADDACIQVLAPFEVNIPLGPQPAGAYRIILNGEVVAEAEGR